MMQFKIYSKKGDEKAIRSPILKTVQKPVCNIGRDDSNDIILDNTDVSPKHAWITKEKKDFFICDLESEGGTFIRGYRIPPKQKIKFKRDAVIHIGQYCLEVKQNGNMANALPLSKDNDNKPELGIEADPQEKDDLQKPFNTGEATSIIELKAEVHQQLLDIIELRRLDFKKTKDEDLRSQCDKIVRKIIADSCYDLFDNFNKQEIIKDILDEALGLGPLEDLIADDSVSEIMVNRPDRIYIEKDGKILRSTKRFSNTRSVNRIISRIVAPLGRRIDESSPMVDARLEDGSRVNVVIPPLSLDGPCLTIRKFSKVPLSMDDMIRYQSISPAMVNFIKACVINRKNILIAGGTGSGKTTALNVFSSFIPGEERVVTIEDAAELQLPQEHVIRLESRPPNIEGKGEITIRALVKNALRMRPDRIIIGECRSGETLDMLQAMNTGHDGSITTIHANSPKDVVSRLETMVLQAGTDLSSRAIREQIASALDIVIQQVRFNCGSRKVTNISEIVGMENDNILMQDIFYFRQEGIDKNGKTYGRFLSTGWIPKYYEELQRSGVPMDMSIFHN